jgi:hypothetical protein
MLNWIDVFTRTEITGAVIWLLLCCIFIAYVSRQSRQKLKTPWARLYDRELR